MWLLAILLLSLLSSCAIAQTVTTTNSAGSTIVQVITTNSLSSTTTQIISTITPTTRTTTTNTITTREIQQAPPSNTGVIGGPTPYTYTTTDSAGVHMPVVATFTPTSPSTVLPPRVTTGSVLQYSDWVSILGTNTPAAFSAASGVRPPQVLSALVCVLLLQLLG